MTETQIAANIRRVQERMAEAASRAGRNPETITLVAVTKTVEPARIAEAYAAGIRDFGENYMQEALRKIGTPPLDGPDVRWHFIGHLQRNKVKEAVGRFALVESVDSVALAQEIGRRAEQAGRVVEILLEVNLASAATRYGFAPEAVAAAAAECALLAGVRMRGLMGMAPYAPDPEAARPYFRQLHALFLQLPPATQQILSMGMSGDFEVAIEEGATQIRIGSALFGPRSP
ncbi:MAG TPA: YggS family pyridoxal phosphate-dependent enzyme [Chthonomonadaceae bacterium]|nr:YggS family pyridoxal phosphate-dependent enzyme [Chthonomonadaceae bacterium]